MVLSEQLMPAFHRGASEADCARGPASDLSYMASAGLGSASGRRDPLPRRPRPAGAGHLATLHPWPSVAAHHLWRSSSA